MLGQATPSLTRSSISFDIIWEVSAKRSDDVATRLDATQCSRIFWVSFTDARPSRPDLVLFWEGLRYSGMAVVEDRPDKVKLLSRRYSLEFDFEQN